MTFRERYQEERRWSAKAILMEIYHLVMKSKHPKWSIQNTAKYFGVSRSLVSENLKLANAMHTNITIQECPSRQNALGRLNGISTNPIGDNSTENK